MPHCPCPGRGQGGASVCAQPVLQLLSGAGQIQCSHTQPVHTATTTTTPHVSACSIALCLAPSTPCSLACVQLLPHGAFMVLLHAAGRVILSCIHHTLRVGRVLEAILAGIDTPHRWVGGGCGVTHTGERGGAHTTWHGAPGVRACSVVDSCHSLCAVNMPRM